MTVNGHVFLLTSDAMARRRVSLHQPPAQSVAKMKVRQSAKIREIADALVSCGFLTLDAQARALGLGRSTAWTILKSCHKGSGLSAKVTRRILASKELPRAVRTKIFEYIEHKATGRYGHSAKLRRKFITALSVQPRSQRRPVAPGLHATGHNSHPVDVDHKPVRPRRAV